MSRLACAFFFVLCNLSCAQSLRDQADQAGVLIGTAVQAGYLSEARYALTLAREFNMLEPEDALKWTALRPSEDRFDFREADRIVAFARQHGMKVRGHNLAWGNHNPDWLADGHFTPAQLRNLLEEHVRTVVGRYRSSVFAWDAVNEPFDEHGRLRDSIWFNRPGIGLADKGTAYIEQILRWAHASDPEALLFINDAEGEALNAKSDAIFAMAQDFRRRGVPLAGVGMQMHILDMNPDVASIAANIARLARLGLQVHITEMDVALPVDREGNASEGDLLQQAEIYREIANACLRTQGCTALETWGFTDRYSWIPWFTQRTKGAALLFDRQYAPKPSCEAVLSALK